MRKSISIILTVVFILSSVLPTYAENEKFFSDIKGHWAEDIIKEKAKRGFISGYDDGTFRPNDNLTKAELITMINKFFGLSKTKDNIYEDVTKEWYSKEADKTEYYQYWKETHLSGNSDATKLDILIILDNLLQVPVTDEIAPFKDIEGLTAEELDLLNRFYAAGYIQGDGQGNVNVLGPLTRAEMLTTFDAYLGYIVITQEDVKYIPKGGKVTIIGQNIILDGIEIEELIISPGVYTDVTIENSKIDILKIYAENIQENIHLISTNIGKVQNPKGITIEEKAIENKKDEPIVDENKADENKADENRSNENGSSGGGNYTIIDAQVPQIITDLTDYSVQENTILNLVTAAIVSDGGIISYEWYSSEDALKSNPQLKGTGASYTVNTTTDGTYFYYCKITNTNTAVNGTNTKEIETAVSKVTVINLVDAQVPQITTDLTDQSVLKNTPLNLITAATVSDGGVISYEWYSADDALKTNPQLKGTDAGLTVNTTTGGVYFYYCKIINTNVAANGINTKEIETAVSKVAVVQMLGEGTEASPFIIKNVENLCLSGTGTNPDGNIYGLSNSYKLEVSLDLADPSSYEDASAHMDNLSGWDYVNENTIARTTVDGNTAGFSPIGNTTDKFTGIFDGNNKTISKLYIIKTTNYTGLFAFTDGAKIYDIGLIDMNLTATYYFGGLVGENQNSTVSNCYGTGVVRGYKLVGGLVGENQNSTVSNCYTNVDVGGADYYIGGLVGINQNSTISNSYALGTVSGDEYVGGLVGQNGSSTISNSYALGTVSGDEHIGGLVGSNFGGSMISNSYATGAINGRLAVGGLSGANEDSAVEDSIAFNSEITGLAGNNRNRVVGDNDSTLISNYANVTMLLYGITVTSNDSVNENGAAIDNMKDKSALPLSNWEFDTDTNGDDAYWVLMTSTNRPVLFIDADGTYVKLGSDDGM